MVKKDINFSKALYLPYHIFQWEIFYGLCELDFQNFLIILARLLIYLSKLVFSILWWIVKLNICYRLECRMIMCMARNVKIVALCLMENLQKHGAPVASMISTFGGEVKALHAIETNHLHHLAILHKLSLTLHLVSDFEIMNCFLTLKASKVKYT